VGRLSALKWTAHLTSLARLDLQDRACICAILGMGQTRRRRSEEAGVPVGPVEAVNKSPLLLYCLVLK
jgi:hypothetical protein